MHATCQVCAKRIGVLKREYGSLSETLNSSDSFYCIVYIMVCACNLQYVHIVHVKSNDKLVGTVWQFLLHISSGDDGRLSVGGCYHKPGA